MRPLVEVRNNVAKYGPWTSLPTGIGVAGEAVSSTFNEPFIGQVRVTVESDGTISEQTTGVRAKAAYPVNMTATAAARQGDHLRVTYAWGSSSNRLADLDGVTMGEFVWQTHKGYYLGSTLTLWAKWPNPPFGTGYWSPHWQPDGVYIDIPDATTGGLDNLTVDDHGQGTPIYVGAAAEVKVFQYYWYQIGDAFRYREIQQVDYGEGIWTVYDEYVGDPVKKVRFADRTITYSVFQQGGVWQYKIDKGGDGSVQIPIPQLPFTAQ
jgi:hypothetical protein